MQNEGGFEAKSQQQPQTQRQTQTLEFERRSLEKNLALTRFFLGLLRFLDGDDADELEDSVN